MAHSLFWSLREKKRLAITYYIISKHISRVQFFETNDDDDDHLSSLVLNIRMDDRRWTITLRPSAVSFRFVISSRLFLSSEEKRMEDFFPG